jgi:hypothetical protein
MGKMKKLVVLLTVMWAAIIVSAQEKIHWDYIDTVYVDGVARACVGDRNDGGQWGLADKNGNTVLQPKYLFLGDFRDGLAKVMNSYYYVGYININGDLVVPCKYMQGGASAGFSNGFDVVRGANGLFGFINRKGEEIVQTNYSYARYVDGKGYALIFDGEVFDKQGYPYPYDFDAKIGVIDTLGREIIGFNKYEYINYGIKPGTFIIKKGDFYGVIDYKENAIIPSVYDRIDNTAGYYRVVQGNKRGLYSTTGKISLPVQYDNVGGLFYKDKTVFCVSQSDKYYLIDEDGKILTTKKYESIGNYVNGVNWSNNFFGSWTMSLYNRAMCKYNGKFGWINIDGEEVIACQYDDVFRNDFYLSPQAGIIAVVKTVNGKYKCGVIDINGQTILPLIYDDLEVLKENIKVELNGRIFEVDKDGNKIKDLDTWR